jgi:hypothetical protein
VNDQVPLPFRNAAFAGLPGGLGFVIIGVSSISGIPLIAKLLGAVIGTLLTVVSIAVAFRPPAALKPRWLREAERKGEIRAPQADGFDRLLLLGFGALVTVLVASLVLMTVLQALGI